MSIDIDREFATIEIIDNFFIIKNVWEEFKVFSQDEFNKARCITVAGYYRCVGKAECKVKKTFTENEEVAIESFFDIVLVALDRFQSLDEFFDYVDNELKELEAIACVNKLGKVMGFGDL